MRSRSIFVDEKADFALGRGRQHPARRSIILKHEHARALSL
jgi:hypothetical protein